MKRSSMLLSAAVVAVMCFGISNSAHAHGQGGPQGQGMMSPGMMHGYGMGPGMMGGYGMCPGMMGHGMMHGYGMGPGMMGHGMMHGYGRGPGMMGQGMMGGYGRGPGMMGPGMMGPTLRQDLSVDDARHLLGHQLAWQGNKGLKLGKVEEKDADTIIAEIVSAEGKVVRRLVVNRHTGRIQAVK